MKKIIAALSLLSISYTAHAEIVTCVSSGTGSVLVRPSSTAGKYTVSTSIPSGNQVENKTYQPQPCTFESKDGELLSASCLIKVDKMTAGFVWEKNGNRFNLNQKVEVEGIPAEKFAALNSTIATDLTCIVTP